MTAANTENIDTGNRDLAREFHRISFQRYGSRNLRSDLITAAASSGCDDLVLAAQIHRGAHHLANIQLDQALAEVEQALRMAGSEPVITRPKIHWWLQHLHGDVLSELGRFDEAFQANRRATDIALTYDLANQWELSITVWAEVTRHLGEAGRSLDLLDLLLADTPFGIPPTRRALADVLLWLGRPRLSMEIRREVVENPEGLTHGAIVYDLVQMARALVDTGQPGVAISHLERADELCSSGGEWPNMWMRIATTRAKVDIQLDRHDAAIERLENLIRSQPGYPSLQARPSILLAQALAARHRLTEALAHLDVVDHRSAGAPNLMDLHETRATVLQELGRPDEAATHLRALIELLDRSYVPESRMVRVEQRLSAWRLDTDGQRATQVEIDRRWMINSRIMNLIAKDLRGPASSLVMGANLATANQSTDDQVNPDDNVLHLLRAAMAELKLSIGHLGDADFVNHHDGEVDIQTVRLSALLQEAKRASEPLRRIRQISLEVAEVADGNVAVDQRLALRAMVGLIRAACAELPVGGAITLTTPPSGADARIIITGLDDHGYQELSNRLVARRLSAEGAANDQPSGWSGLSLTLSSLMVRGGRITVASGVGEVGGRDTSSSSTSAPPQDAADFVVDIRFGPTR